MPLSAFTFAFEFPKELLAMLPFPSPSGILSGLSNLGLRVVCQDSFKFLTYQPCSHSHHSSLDPNAPPPYTSQTCFCSQYNANMADRKIPVMFTLPPSNRHELILLDTEKPSLKALNKQITSTIESSPNCAECSSPVSPPSYPLS